MDVCFYTVCSPISVGCKLYQDNLATVPVLDGFYSDGINCYTVVGGVITEISSCEVIPPEAISCTGIINVDGVGGVYTLSVVVGSTTGTTGIMFDSINIPDRYQIFYDGDMVADSKYVGNFIVAGSIATTGFYGTKSNLPIFEYDSGLGDFVNTGNIYPSFDVGVLDVANNLDEPTVGYGPLLFRKETASPTTIDVKVFGVVPTTQWNLSGVCPVPDSEITPNLTSSMFYGFYNYNNRQTNYKRTSMRLYYDIDNSDPVRQFYLTPLGAGTPSAPIPEYMNDLSKIGWGGEYSENVWINFGGGALGYGAYQIDQFGKVIDTDL